MLKLEQTEYDLNTLFSFDVLKEILLKLAKSQIKLENEIANIKNTLKNREEDFGMEEYKEESSYDNINDNLIQNQNININYNGNNQENNNEKEIKEENKDNKDNKEKFEQNENQKLIEKNKESNNNVNENDNYNNLEDKKDTKEDKKENYEDKKDKEKESDNKSEEKIIEEKNFMIKKTEIPEVQLKNTEKENLNNIPTTTTISNNKTNQKLNNIPSSPNKTKNQVSKNKTQKNETSVSPEVITKIMRQLKSQQDRIEFMSKSFNSELAPIKKFNLKHSNINSQFLLINDKINSLLEKNKDYDKKIEDLQVKIANFDVFSMFQDSGDGTIDATKVLVKSLEDKVFKKFELIDQRYKVDSLENLKLKNNVENIIPKINQFNMQIEKINDNEIKYQEQIDNIKKENEENTNELKTIINNDINNSLENTKNNFEQNLENKISDLEKKIAEIKQSGGDNFDLLKLGIGNNEITQDTIDSLDKKITDLRKKIHDINNTLKLHMSNNEIDALKNELKDMKIILDKKITKDDLKELYNYHMNTNDEINDMKDQIALTFDDERKIVKDISTIQQKIESINGNLSLLRDNPKVGSTPIIDFGKFIDQNKLTDTLRPLLKEMEKLFREIESVRRDLSVVDEENKKNVKNQVNKLEEEINKKINDLKNNIQKKYLEKLEFNKTIKTLEVQIKSLGDEGKKDADSWLLAKRPLKCFNCASCEANIKNDYNSADYLPWKKYPKGEKIHRMGQGFSHMLQMMTSEFVKSIERNELNQDLEINTKNNFSNFNSISTQFNEKNNFNNNKDNSNNDFIKNLKKSKMRLPKVHPSNSKLKECKLEDTLPVSEDDYNYQEVINNNNEEDLKEQNNPKILKIYKKKGNKESYDNLAPTSVRNERLTRNLEFSKKFNNMKTDKNLYDKEE